MDIYGHGTYIILYLRIMFMIYKCMCTIYRHSIRYKYVIICIHVYGTGSLEIPPWRSPASHLIAGHGPWF